MRILTAELRKVLTLRFFLILAVAVAANFLLFRHDMSGDFRIYSQESYITAQKDLLAMDSSQRADWLKERYAMLRACSSWESYDRIAQSGSSSNIQITEDMLKYQSVYESGDYLHYADNLYAEQDLIRSLMEQLLQVEEHHDTLNAAIEDARLKTSFSIFAKPGTFAYRSQMRTIERLQQLLYIQPRYDISDGVLRSQTSAVTDLIGLMLILFLCVEMVVTEQKNGMLPILRATQEGRLPLIVSKITATFVLTLLVTAALWGMNTLYCGTVFGFGDLSRPIQSLTGFTTSTLEISVGSYMALFFLSKWLLYTAVGVLCLVLGLLLNGAMPTWLALGGFLSVEYILCQTIPSISAWNVLKFINISNLIFHTDYLAEYRNLNLFGYPVEVFTVSCVLLGLVLAGSILTACWLFCRRQTSISLPRLKLKWPRWLPRPGKSTRLSGHEVWKLLIECGGLLVLVLFVLLNVSEPRYVAYGTEGLYYKNYMEALEGPLTEKTDAYLAAEEERFASIRQELAQIRQLYSEGKISSAELDILQSPLNRQLEPQRILNQQIYPKIAELKAMAAEGKEAWLVYEPGYEYLLNLDPYHDKTGAAAMLLAGVILCFSGFYPLESTSGMLPILNTYPQGRKKTARSKLMICAGMTVLLFLIAQIPDYWYVIRNYGFPALNAPLCSLPGFTGWSDGVTILGGIVIYEALRLMTILALAGIVTLISLWTRNQIVTMSISAGLLLMPLLLHLLEIYFLDKVSFYLPLTGSGLLANQENAASALLFYGAVLLLGVLSVYFTLRYAGHGYRHTPLRQNRGRSSLSPNNT